MRTRECTFSTQRIQVCITINYLHPCLKFKDKTDIYEFAKNNICAVRCLKKSALCTRNSTELKSVYFV